jgi:PAS domain S-box-containing protein
MTFEDIETLLDCLPLPSLIVSTDAPDFTVAAVNKAYVGAVSQESKEWVGRSFFEVFTLQPGQEDAMNTIRRAFEHVLHFRTPHQIERHHYTPNGQQHPRCWKIDTYPLLDNAGALTCIAQSLTAVSISGHLDSNNSKPANTGASPIVPTQVEIELRKSNERYAYVSKASGDAIYDWDLIEDNIIWGDGFSRIFGHPLSGEKYPLESWSKLVHPADVSSIETDLQRALNDPETINWTAQYRIKNAQGHYAFAEETGYIVRNTDGLAIRMIGALRDVTERKENAAALEASERRYSDLFHLSPLPMWVYDLKTYQFLDVNEAATRLYGYSREEFCAMTIKDIRPAEDWENFLKQLGTEVTQGRYHSGIARHIKKSGEMMFVSVNGNSITYGVKEARLVVAIDKTDTLRAEGALKKSEQRFKHLIQEGSDLIAVLGEDGSFQYVSPTAERVIGVKASELIGKNGFMSVHDEDRDEVIRNFERIKEEKRIELAPFRIIDGKGEIRWMETIVTDMRDNEAVGGIITNARDVTQRMVAELQNKENLERYNAVAKATSDTIWDCNLLTGDIRWNHGISQVFGYEKPVGRYDWWHEHVHPEDVEKVAEKVRITMENRESRWSSDYRFRCADGGYKFVFDRGFVLFDDNGQPVRMIGAMQDITERIKYVKEIEEHNARLKEITWTQAHLVRAPLSRIMGIVQLVSDPGTDDITKETLMSYLQVSANELDDVIRTIIRKSQPV